MPKGYEQLGPLDRLKYDSAHDLALHANRAENAADEAAQGAAMNLANQLDANPHDREMVDHLRKEFRAAEDEAGGDFYSAAVRLMPSRTVIDRAIQAAEAETEHDESFASPEVWAVMTPEQRQLATELRDVIASGPLAEYGITKDTLRIIKTTASQTNDAEMLALIYTGPGVPLGGKGKSGNFVVDYSVSTAANNRLYLVRTNDGNVWDVRKGMTEAVYEAKIADALMRDGAFAHRQQSRKIVLTGESQRGHYVLVGHFVGGQITKFTDGLDNNRGSSGYYICPSVIIGTALK